MKEIKLTKYASNDGTIFDTEKECIEYENNQKEYTNLKEAIMRIQALCNNTHCNLCPFCKDYCMFDETTPSNWEIDE